MDYNLVLKFKKYPESKPDGEVLYTVILLDRYGNYFLGERSGYFEKNGTWKSADGDDVVAFCEYTSNKRMIEFLNFNHETILVTKQYLEKLEHSDNFLSALQEAGVDNWCGYDEAREIMSRNEDED